MPVLNDKEYPDLNYLNLMIATQYKRFRRWEDHSLSVFSAKSGVALFITFYLLTLLKIVIVSFDLSSLKQQFSDYYYYPFGIFWVGTTSILHKKSISNNVLAELTLYPEEYIKGVKLSFLHYILSIMVFGLLLLYTKPPVY